MQVREIDNESYVKDLWNKNAEVWVKLNREGYNIWRDHFTAPQFLNYLPCIENQVGLDVGCGEGYSSSLLIEQHAKQVVGLDISDRMIYHAEQAHGDVPNLKFVCGSASNIPFERDSFDFATAFFSIMNMPNYPKILKELHRVVKPGGFFQFSITHPCFWTQNLCWTEDKQGVICKNYSPKSEPIFAEWTFEGAPEGYGKLLSVLYRRSFSEWLNHITATGFYLERLEELMISTSLIKQFPVLTGYDKLPFFLIIRARKPQKLML